MQEFFFYSVSTLISRGKHTASILKTNSGQILKQKQFWMRTIFFLCRVLTQIGMCSQIFAETPKSFRIIYQLGEALLHADGQPNRYTANSPFPQMFTESVHKRYWSIFSRFVPFNTTCLIWKSLSWHNKLSDFEIQRAASCSLRLNMAILIVTLHFMSHSQRPNACLLCHLRRSHFLPQYLKFFIQFDFRRNLYISYGMSLYLAARAPFTAHNVVLHSQRPYLWIKYVP
jgi:hypothetical protein